MIRYESPKSERDDRRREGAGRILRIERSDGTALDLFAACNPFTDYRRKIITSPAMVVLASIGAGRSHPAGPGRVGGER